MKLFLLILSVLFLSFAAQAGDPNAEMTDGAGAGWFSPDCPDCKGLQMPGRASLGNDDGNYYTKGRKKRKPIPQGGHSPDNEATEK